jgi:signal transduction histidine kinase
MIVTEARWERTARAVAPAALGLFAAIGAAQSRQPAALAVAIWLAVVAGAALLAWRGTTGWPLLGGLAGLAVGITLLCHADAGNAGWFGLCVLAGWAALATPLPRGALLGAGLLGVFVVEWLVSDDHGWAPWLAGTVFTIVATAFARRQRELVVELERAHAGLAERTRAEERNRIAAEVHDVIGHALTVTLLHLDSARLALDDEPEQARAALAQAEQLARASLAEVRATVGLARAGNGAEVAPLPTAADVGDLVESFRRAGTRVDLVLDGDPARLTGTQGLVLYRIVQESLTNAVRHGDGSPVSVGVTVADRATTISVVSGGGARPDRSPGGTGLISMRERAEAVGGHVHAGPTPTGWRVEAVLPA